MKARKSKEDEHRLTRQRYPTKEDDQKLIDEIFAKNYYRTGSSKPRSKSTVAYHSSTGDGFTNPLSSAKDRNEPRRSLPGDTLRSKNCSLATVDECTIERSWATAHGSSNAYLVEKTGKTHIPMPVCHRSTGWDDPIESNETPELGGAYASSTGDGINIPLSATKDRNKPGRSLPADMLRSKNYALAAVDEWTFEPSWATAHGSSNAYLAEKSRKTHIPITVSHPRTGWDAPIERNEPPELRVACTSSAGDGITNPTTCQKVPNEPRRSLANSFWNLEYESATIYACPIEPSWLTAALNSNAYLLEHTKNYASYTIRRGNPTRDEPVGSNKSPEISVEYTSSTGDEVINPNSEERMKMKQRRSLPMPPRSVEYTSAATSGNSEACLLETTAKTYTPILRRRSADGNVPVGYNESLNISETYKFSTGNGSNSPSLCEEVKIKPRRFLPELPPGSVRYASTVTSESSETNHNYTTSNMRRGSTEGIVCDRSNEPRNFGGCTRVLKPSSCFGTNMTDQLLRRPLDSPNQDVNVSLESQLLPQGAEMEDVAQETSLEIENDSAEQREASPQISDNVIIAFGRRIHADLRKCMQCYMSSSSGRCINVFLRIGAVGLAGYLFYLVSQAH